MGFVKLALRNNIPLVPVYVFGTNDTFRTSKFLQGARLGLVRRLRCFTLFDFRAVIGRQRVLFIVWVVERGFCFALSGLVAHVRALSGSDFGVKFVWCEIVDTKCVCVAVAWCLGSPLDPSILFGETMSKVALVEFFISLECQVPGYRSSYHARWGAP